MFEQLSCPVAENYSLSGLTTMGVGGPARYYIVPQTIDDVVAAKEICREQGLNVLVLGNGSNILVDDEGFDGAVLHVGKGLRSFERRGDSLYAESGVMVPKISFSMAKEGITGYEFMAGIPGTVGGAVVMNAGCIGRETSMILESVTYLDQNGNVITKPASELDLSFRSSFFIGKSHIILSAMFTALPGDQEEVMKMTKKAADIRKGKFPVNVATVGSTFKSPPEGPHPGRLVEEVGLKGHQIGGAEVSHVHANWIINRGGAKASDVKKLIDVMQNTVAQKLGILMEPEVLFV
ncbi:UDP-N-acetylenolpyruvoylglucosamine reductase [Paenibacillus sambharensis]|uniref:UDP-N-acetylenolpyruvoylglucosamine reductase n=1 Tax=Paenibacillus sambharensis TaxID=1803190 RepID=A0A2W1LFY4_9BACL|nr:UDP-N-acetylmuramate dehydrogenase [Paenibacillus sambharensis]PZD97733.1 UDP-N-acetylenolpyruvoylglucosamine reductase [Paenibacillus sambharensis]